MRGVLTPCQGWLSRPSISQPAPQHILVEELATAVPISIADPIPVEEIEFEESDTEMVV